MKIWIVNINKSTIRTFLNQSDYDSWFHRDPNVALNDVDNSVVTIYDATPIESRTIKEIKDSIKDSNIRESRIQAVVSDDPWFSKFENFKNELGKYPNAQPMIEKLSMFSDKKIITKYLKAQKDFLLCDITDDVKWFELLIDFIGIKEMVDGSYKKLNGYNTKVMVSRKRKDNFLKAKENVQKTV
jgi:hypothetical protein